MDKYEYKLKLEQLKHLVEEKDYKTAAEIADTINWRKVKSASTLCMVGEIYDRDKQYENSREILLMAYDRATVGRNIIYRLALVSLKMGKVEEAKEYYEEFLEIAPYDNLKYVLRYQIAKIEGASLEEQIGILEEFKSREYTEEWAFELAYLYHRSGNSEKCVEVCDELALWFGDGKYVEKALELKMLYQPLSKEQEEKYRQFKTHQDGTLEIHSTELMESGEIIQDTVRIPDLTAESGRFNTLNLQEELVKGMQQIIEADTRETVSDTMDNIKKIVEEIPYLQVPQEEEAVEEEERYGHIETDEEIDGSLETDFQEMLAEDWDGQIRLSVPGGEWWEPQVNGQIKIEDVLTEWEKTKRAAEAAMAVAQQRKLESAKARALQEAEELMERLNHIIPKLNAGITPQELLAERYLQSAKEDFEQPSQEGVAMEEPFLEMPGMGEGVPQMEMAGMEEEVPGMGMPGMEEGVSQMEIPGMAEGMPGMPGMAGMGMPELEGFSEMPGMAEPEGYSGVPGMAEPEGYSGMPGISEPEGYSGMPGMVGPEGYSGMPGMAEPEGYSGMPGMAGPEGYSGVPGMAEPEGYSGMPGISEPEGYSGMPGISGPEGYSGVPGMAEQEEYAGIPGMGMPGMEEEMPGMPEMAGPEEYAGMPGMAEPEGFSGMEGAVPGMGMAEPEGYSGMPGMAEPGGYAGMPGVAEPEGYSGMPGMAEPGGYAGMPGMEEAVPGMEQGFSGMGMPGIEEEIPEIPEMEMPGMEQGVTEIEEAALQEEAWMEYPGNGLAESPREVLPENAAGQQIQGNEFAGMDGEIPGTEDALEMPGIKEADKEAVRVLEKAVDGVEDKEKLPQRPTGQGVGKPPRQQTGQGMGKPPRQQTGQGVGKPEKKDAEQYLESVFQAARASREEKDHVSGPAISSEEQSKGAEVTIDLENVGKSISRATAVHEENTAVPEIEIDPEAGTVRKLTEEQREIFSYFVPVTGMEQQLCQALEGALHRKGKNNSSASGNILIMGGRGSGKTVLATDFIKAIQKEEGNSQGKVGKITGDSLNQKDLSQLLKKVAGGYLIIEKAGEMTQETVTRLSLLMEQNTDGLLFLMEDTRKGIEKVLSLDMNFAKKFTERIKIPVFTSDELVEFAKAYADEQECEIDDMGILALYNRISNIQKLDEATTLAEVKEIVDMAISSAERGGLKKLFGGKKFSPEGYLYLREKDFEE